MLDLSTTNVGGKSDSIRKGNHSQLERQPFFFIFLEVRGKPFLLTHSPILFHLSVHAVLKLCWRISLVISGSTFLKDVHIGIPSSGGEWLPLFSFDSFFLLPLSYIHWKSGILCSFRGQYVSSSRFLWILSLSSRWF